MTLSTKQAIAQLRAQGDAQKASEMHRYHKVDRPYLGVANPVIDTAVKEWRAQLDLDQRLSLTAGLWRSNIHEARVAAAKLLTQARIKPDDSGAWELICNWVPEFDAWAVADHACIAGQKRLVANPDRLDTVEAWIVSDHMWTRRAALVMTLPWSKQNNPKPEELEARDRILGWAASYVPDRDWFIQKSIGWWLRELSKHDPDRVKAFLAEHSTNMKPFAVREASRKLTP